MGCESKERREVKEREREKERERKGEGKESKWCPQKGKPNRETEMEGWEETSKPSPRDIWSYSGSDASAQ